MKTAIISGASRGIGATIAKRLANNGYFVIINYLVNKNQAQSVLDECGGQGVIWQADVSDCTQIDSMIEGIIRLRGSVDLLVCNAGISKSGLLIDMTTSDIMSVITTNLIGTINCCKSVAKYMLSQHSGKIVNISSMWGEVGASCESVYSASKGGIISFSKSLAKELGYNGINVNCITPGLINTEMNSQLSRQDLDDIVGSTPCGRIGAGQDVASVVEWLASDDANFINGQVIGVNGGFVI